MTAVRCSSFKAPVVQHFHFFTCKDGVKWPHPGTRLMDILGLWSLAVLREETKDAFFHLEMLPENSGFADEVLFPKNPDGSAINTLVAYK